jgi:hypothetical protein
VESDQLHALSAVTSEIILCKGLLMLLVNSLLKRITLNKNLFYVYHIKFIEVCHCLGVLLVADRQADGMGNHVMNNSFSLKASKNTVDLEFIFPCSGV